MTVLTGGTFDLLHYGHILHLRVCAGLAQGIENVTVMLVSDQWGEERKRKPIISYLERVKILEALGVKNIVPVDRPEDLARWVSKLAPEIYVYEYGTNPEAHKEALERCGTMGIMAMDIGKSPGNPFGTSTTEIINRIKNEDTNRK